LEVQMTRALQVVLVAVCGSLLACSQDVDTGRRCADGDKRCGESPRNVGTAGRPVGGAGGSASNQSGTGGNAVGNHDDALTVDVQDIRKMTIEIVTLQCAGDCADVEAVAHGGNPPYAFAWEDGSTSATRHVCLDASATLRVAATDTAIDSEEFDYDAHTVYADVTATVLDCSQPDAGVPIGTGECAELAYMTVDAACPVPEAGVLNYLDAPIRAGVAYAYSVVGDGNYIAGDGWDYELWSSPDGCAQDELLGTYSLAQGPIDVHFCFTPTRSQPRLVLKYTFQETDGVSFSPTTLSLCDACER
jgi:hypothetical protein